jgi:indolepyruvate ferredoxin oxidoreductase
MLRALGLKRKLRLGRWFVPVYWLLRAMRPLRFTLLDPFGRAEVRRVERRLIDEYRAMLEALLPGLTAERHDAAVELARLPAMIRGYEKIKLANVARYHDRVDKLHAQR